MKNSFLICFLLFNISLGTASDFGYIIFIRPIIENGFVENGTAIYVKNIEMLKLQTTRLDSFVVSLTNNQNGIILDFNTTNTVYCCEENNVNDGLMKYLNWKLDTMLFVEYDKYAKNNYGLIKRKSHKGLIIINNEKFTIHIWKTELDYCECPPEYNPKYRTEEDKIGYVRAVKKVYTIDKKTKSLLSNKFLIQ